MKRVCKGDELTVSMAGNTFFKAKLTLDATKTPKTVDYEMTEGITKGKKQRQFSWIESWTDSIVDGPTPQSRGMSITLSDWFYEGILMDGGL